MEELNELEKIGLAFVSGMVAGQAIQSADEEVEKQGNKKCNKNNDNFEIKLRKLEGTAAENFVKFINDMGVR